MLQELDNKLKDNGYDTDFDTDGIYLPKYSIDIIKDNSNYIIKPKDDEPVIANNIDDALLIIKDFSYGEMISEELDENNYHYNKESARFFSLGNDKIKVIDGRFYLQDDEGSTNVYVDIPSVIGALQSKFLGEK
ncbi:hypothetical protein [Staphylococcus equorum]|uniref:hypothetical protein n=1 Tax=Staphylococcus equorum TaxID=246432 RepID=UPI0008531348|nr:hypothetical protein [Staphylococcus equorum]OEL08309.1 hypothetical protein AST04_08975 [Staphylococcus equorum]